MGTVRLVRTWRSSAAQRGQAGPRATATSHGAGQVSIWFLLLSFTIVITGCGGGSRATPPPAAGPTAQGAPALLKQKVRKGEVMVDAEYSPHRDGLYRFDGTYLVRFAQYDPESPRMSFAGQTPFVAELRAWRRPKKIALSTRPRRRRADDAAARQVLRRSQLRRLSLRAPLHADGLRPGGPTASSPRPPNRLPMNCLGRAAASLAERGGQAATTRSGACRRRRRRRCRSSPRSP